MRTITIALALCIGLVALALVLSQHARAAERMVITLSCDGTVKDASMMPISNYPIPLDRTPKPVSTMAVVVNLAARTVSFEGFVAAVNTVDTANVTFGGGPIGPLAQITSKAGNEMDILGTLDRVTGHMEATVATGLKGRLYATDAVTTIKDFEVTCRAAKPGQ